MNNKKTQSRTKLCKICGEYYSTDDITHFLEGCLDNLDAQDSEEEYAGEGWEGGYDDDFSYDY